MTDRAKEEFDVVVVGSGAGGGMAAYRLAASGAKVALVEAGRDYEPLMETPMFNSTESAPLRGAQTEDKAFNYYNAAIGGWNVPGEPFATAEGTEFMWFRARMLGGRTNHWGRHVPRFGAIDFKPGTNDGLSPDWPLDYAEIAPFYDKTEAVMGVSGVNTGLEHHPGSPARVLQPAPKPRVTDLFVAAGARKMGLPCFPRRNAILTRAIDDRMPCFYATPCIRGCSIGAAFQSTTSLIPAAAKTGNLTIFTNAKVYEVLTDSTGRATGVAFHDTRNGAIGRIRGRAVVLAASACSSAQILLNSGNGATGGLANSSGQVGRNLTDSTGTGVRGQFPALENRPRYDEHGVSLDHFYMPWWGYDQQRTGELKFPRGYHVELGGGFRQEPDMGIGGIGGHSGKFGEELREDMVRYYGSFLSFTGRGEMVPSEKCYCELDAEMKDEWGVPVLRFHFEWSEHELAQVEHMMATFEELVDQLGGKVVSPKRTAAEAISIPGEIIHEVGTTRMGSKPDNSVTDNSGRCWDVDNLYVMDGGVFASNPHKNPTLTIMALAWRNSEILADRLRKGEL